MLPELDSQALLTIIWKNSVEGIVLLDKDNYIVNINPAYTEIMGFTAEEAIGAHSSMTRSGFYDEKFYKEIWDKVHETGQWTGEMMIRRKNGAVFSEWLSLNAIKNLANEITHYLVIFSDITERQTSLERIRFLANYDPLTKLPNYTNLVNQLDVLLKNINQHIPLAVFSIGIDGFKNINASFGLEVGDKLLQQFAERLQTCFIQSGMLARFSGDKFVVLFPNMIDNEAIRYILQSILVVAHRPYLIHDQQLSITASIGISVCPEDGVTSDSLLKNAETALFQAKAQGRNSYQFFAEHMNETAKERFTLENKLRYAIENQEFELYYHPIVSLKTCEIVSAEALIRWNHPGASYISPDKFIPIAENSGLIIPITDWVLMTACQENYKWLQAELPLVPIAVNISANQFAQKNFKDMIIRLLKSSKINANSLKLEITESMLMQNTDVIIQILTELKAIGVRISMDDFGTGYSSFSYLKKLPIDDLKIDKFFIRDIDKDEESKAIVLSIINLAKTLKLNTIAEGVETMEQIEFLRLHGCDYIQGYYFSKPVNSRDFMAMLSDRKRLE
jgi:diguanylate cyclase (GGDEF)-like protein/PAS domain S-box-containing protein